jgi:hypothetical protein
VPSDRELANHRWDVGTLLVVGTNLDPAPLHPAMTMQ